MSNPALRALIERAQADLSKPELDVWLAKHVFGYGRRKGSLALGISEDAWRYRLTCAERKLTEATTEAA